MALLFKEAFIGLVPFLLLHHRGGHYPDGTAKVRWPPAERGTAPTMDGTCDESPLGQSSGTITGQAGDGPGPMYLHARRPLANRAQRSGGLPSYYEYTIGWTLATTSVPGAAALLHCTKSNMYLPVPLIHCPPAYRGFTLLMTG